MTKNKAKLDIENSTITLNGLSYKLQNPLVKPAQDSFIPPHMAQDISVSLAKQLISHVILLEPVSSLQRKFNGLDTIVAMARNITVSIITGFVSGPQEPDCTEDSPQELTFDVAPPPTRNHPPTHPVILCRRSRISGTWLVKPSPNISQLST